MTGAPQLALDLGHRPALGREDFLVAPSNERAVAWIDRWPEWPAPALIIHGPAACGKTHLAQVWRARTGAAVVETDGDLGALPADTGCCIVEAAEARRGEVALFHLFDRLAARGGHLLLTARRPPSRWDDGLPDLLSRLRAAPAVAVGPPDDALIAAVLVKLFADRQLRIGADVVSYLITHMERSFGAARRLVAASDAAALAARRRVTVPLVRDVLGALDGGANPG